MKQSSSIQNLQATPASNQQKQSGSPIVALQNQLNALRLEYDYERTEYQRQADLAGVERLVKQGKCWYPISVGRSYYNSLNQLVVEVFRIPTNEEEADEHHFESGRSVAFFTKDSKMRITATVNLVDADRMVVALPNASALNHLQQADLPGVQLAFDESTFQLMFNALHEAIQAKNNRLAELRDIFHSTLKPQKFTFLPVRFPWLNTTQQAAVNEVLWAKDVEVVHGPPGTGKTTTMVEAVYETLRRENQVLVCAQSNMAVDWIAEQLVDRGVSVLRIGHPSKVNDKMLSFTYERRFEAHPDYPQLWQIRKDIRQLRQTRKSLRSEAFHQKMERLKDRATELEVRIHSALMNDARVIACTLAGSANRVLTGVKFNTLFIDEAAQAMEAACWIAIRKANRVILAGDHQQLPPTIQCLEAQRAGLDHTLMEAIVRNHPEAVSLLQTQYRMNQSIMQFSNQWFYEGKVQSAPNVEHRSVLDYDIPMQWIDTSALEDAGESTTRSESRVNKAEAIFTIQQLQMYIARIGKERVFNEHIDFGLISPYSGQVQQLRQMVRKNAFFKPYRHLITINTVDGFQGQERDVIFISLVRSNQQGAIGFLNDLRRMNVAITRARMKLVILGDRETLAHHAFYKKLMDYVDALHQSIG